MDYAAYHLRLVLATVEPIRKECTNEASQYTLRLRLRGSFTVDVTVALFCVWQDCNHEGVDHRCGLRRRHD